MSGGFKYEIGQYVYGPNVQGKVQFRDKSFGKNRYALDNGKVYNENELRDKPSEKF